MKVAWSAANCSTARPPRKISETGAMRISAPGSYGDVSNHQAEFADFFAEDQVAEAFARAWTSWPKVRRHPAPRAWVVRTALNTGASWWRRRGRELPLAGHDLAVLGDPDSGLDAPLLTAIWQLPARQREVIALRIFLDLDTTDIASAGQALSVGRQRQPLMRGRSWSRERPP
jgi:DNA-directed RNA polymerase specialized sigma24 family protein